MLTGALLIAAGLAAGFVAGLLGLGGGLLFGPVLLYYFGQAGVGDAALSKLTAGTSLLCVLVVASASAWHRHRQGVLLPGVAWRTGLLSAGAVVLTTQFVTTQPWYDRSLFQLVLGVLLAVVAVRMLRGSTSPEPPGDARDGAAAPHESPRWPLLAGTGAGAGAISAAAGVGGGIVLVPAYRRLFGLPMSRASGTSSGAIVLIAAVGVASYAFGGWGASGLPASATGYVDAPRAALLALPSILGARLGVRAAGSLSGVVLRRSFALVALVVAGRLLYEVIGP